LTRRLPAAQTRFSVAAVVVVALALAGCGGGSTSGTTSSQTSAKRAEIRRELKSVAKEMQHSPKANAYEAALRSMDHTPTLLALRPKIVALLPKMTAYADYIRSLRFPACLRGAQDLFVRMLHESEAMTRGALPVMATHNEVAVYDYLEKAHELTSEITKKVQAKANRLISAGGAC
jgi:hypothetical protein